MYFTLAEGRKKGKDTKALGKKKRSLSSEDEGKESSGGGTAQKNNKKQKVNQGKESRKGQKVNTIISFHLTNAPPLFLYFKLIL